MSSAPRSRPGRFWLMLAGVQLAGMVLVPSARCDDHGVVFAGVDSGSDRSLYVGGTVPAPGWAFGHGVGIRAIVFSSQYSYDSGPTRIDGSETGIDVAAIYQWSGDWGYANLAAGPRYHDTRLSPQDSGNRSRGAKWDGFAAADGARNFGKWRVAGFVSYGVDLGEYYGRLELTGAVTDYLRLGAEAVAQGDPYYQRQLYGPVLSFSPTAKWDLRVSGGAEYQEGRSGAYAGAFVSHVF